MLEDSLSRALLKSGVSLERLSLAAMGRALVALSLAGITASTAVRYLHPIEMPDVAALFPLPSGSEQTASAEPVPVVVLPPSAVAAPAPPPEAPAPVANANPPLDVKPLVRGPTPAVRPAPAPSTSVTTGAPSPEVTAPATFTPAMAPGAPAVIATLAKGDEPRSGGAAAPTGQDQPATQASPVPPAAKDAQHAPRRRAAEKTGLSPGKAAKLFFRDIKRVFMNF